MKLYTLLAVLSGIVILEGVVVELLHAARKRVTHPVLVHVTDLGRYLNQWFLPMMGLAATGGVLLKIAETFPLGGLLGVSGSAVFSLFLVVLLTCLTSDTPKGAAPLP